MKDKKVLLFYCLFCIMGIGIYSLCVFVITDSYSNRFWIAYGFTTAAFVSQVIIPSLLYFGKTLKNDGFLGIPLLIPSSIYLVVQLVTGVILMIIPVPVKLTLIIEVVIFSCFVFVTFALKEWGKAAVESDIRIEESTIFVEDLTIHAERLYEEMNSPERKAELKKMWEVIRYSDPVSNDDLVCSVNKQIEKAFEAVCKDSNTKTKEEFSKDVKVVIDLVNRRNAICKRNK